jgi:hypothetical protein
LSEKRNNTANTNRSPLGTANNNLDEGVSTFGLWLNSQDKTSSETPVIMKEFAEGKRVTLQDNLLQKDVIVTIAEGIPFCNECSCNDCAHVGFTICAIQLSNKSKIA